MLCAKCKTENPDGLKFCNECGAPFKTPCASCGFENASTAKFCGACGGALSNNGVGIYSLPAPSSASETQTVPRQIGDSAPSKGERRHLTVLFCDLVSSTEIAAHLDPEEWRDIVARYQRVAAETVAHFDGHVAQYLGDGVLALFGYPTAHENDAERAVRTGLEIIERVSVLSAELDAKGLPALAARVGIHAGPVVVGDSDNKSANVFGDTPNVAARVQAAAESNTVVVSAAVHQLVSGLFVVEDRGAQQLKGVPQPVALYRVVQPSGVRSRLDLSAGHHTPFVGRQSELGVLADAWERVVEGMGQTVLVQGDAGIGKSRLCYQLRVQLGDQPHTWLECRCSPYTTGTPFRPVIELVEQALTFQPTDRLGKLQVGLERGGFAGDETVALLAEWMELPQSAGYTPLATNPDVKRRKTLETLAAWNLKLAELQPMVVLVEDLHWSDPSSLDLVGRLIAQSPTARVMLIGTARPEFVAPWPERSNLTTIKLARLTKRQARSIIERVAIAMENVAPSDDHNGARLAALTQAITDTIIARADGIPLYLEELTRTARAEEIPATLADSLMARLDRLGGAKEVAQRASVLGREFSYPLLAAVVGLEEAALCRELARLDEAEILFVRGEPPQSTYTFKHALVQEAAYESMLKRTRRQLHGRVVDVMREQFPELAAAAPEVIARHAELAGQTDDAIMYYQRAGEQAQARSAHGEAIAQFRKAIALLETEPAGADRDSHEVALQLLLGGSLMAERGFPHPEVEAPYERARILCEAVGDARRLGIAQLGLSYFHYNRGDVERGRVLAAEVLASAEAQRSPELLVMAHQNVAETEHYQGKFASSLTHCERAFALYDPARHSEFLLGSHNGVPALGYAAWNLWILGWPDSALTRAQEAVSLGRRLNHPFSLVRALFFETLIQRTRRDHARQQERAAEVVALSEMHGFALYVGWGRKFYAATRVVAGDAAGLRESLEAVTLIREAGYQTPGIFYYLAETQQAGGQLAEARATVAAALTISAQLAQPLWDADLHRLDGELILASGGARDEAAACYQQALDVARAQGAKSLELRAATSLARLLIKQGKRNEARLILTEIYNWFTEGFNTADLKDAKALLEELRA
jgi:class 3 adenylate cyclase/tetratricopeptide (TPR) repeat protein